MHFLLTGFLISRITSRLGFELQLLAEELKMCDRIEVEMLERMLRMRNKILVRCKE